MCFAYKTEHFQKLLLQKFFSKMLHLGDNSLFSRLSGLKCQKARGEKWSAVGKIIPWLSILKVQTQEGPLLGPKIAVYKILYLLHLYFASLRG